MMVDYYKLNQLVTLIVAAMLNGLSSLQLEIWLLIWTNMFFSISIGKEDLKWFTYLKKDTSL